MGFWAGPPQAGAASFQRVGPEGMRSGVCRGDQGGNVGAQRKVTPLSLPHIPRGQPASGSSSLLPRTAAQVTAATHTLAWTQCLQHPRTGVPREPGHTLTHSHLWADCPTKSKGGKVRSMVAHPYGEPLHLRTGGLASLAGSRAPTDTNSLGTTAGLESMAAMGLDTLRGSVAQTGTCRDHRSAGYRPPFGHNSTRL